MNYHKIKIVEYHRSTDLRNSTIFFGAQDWICNRLIINDKYFGGAIGKAKGLGETGRK